MTAPGWELLLALAAALALWSPRTALAAHRVRSLRAPPEPPDVAGVAGPTSTRRLLAGAAGLAAGLLVGGLPGVVVATVVAVLAERWLAGAAGGDGPHDRTSLLRDLPGACDLLALCLTAGVPVGAALTAVGGAVPAPLGRHLSDVAALLRLGAEPRRAWADAPAELGALGRLLVRAGESGATAAPGLRALATDIRADVRAAGEAAVRRAGVWVLAPLAACFLPAFVCLGVVPIVLGIAGDVFG
ncbi:type II secretion system F family protein [Blastococcus deserti]|uniref:Type II secretion system F family protein n=1 Tax=Blastococcus deserti TaxID=2259033 RepID=A0ABW4XAR9_9ACTN